MRTQILAAIIAFSCRVIRIAGNVVDQARPARSPRAFAAGIASDVGFRQLDVTENSVDRISNETQPRSDETALGSAIALYVNDFPDRRRPIIVDTGSTRYEVTNTRILARAISVRSRGTASVRGNKLNGAGAAPAVVFGVVGEGEESGRVSPFGPLTFAENFCELGGRMKPEDGSRPVAVMLTASALVLPDNQVRSSWEGDGIAVRAGVGLIDDHLSAVTATGNITDGEIRVNGVALQPPWQPLNIRLS